MKSTDVRRRKPTHLVFIRHECDHPECMKRLTEKMIAVCQTLGIEKFDEVILGSNASETLREKGIPELWLYDFQAGSSIPPTEPMRDYYILKFDDGSMKVVLMLMDEEEDEGVPPPLDPMYG